MQIDRAVNPMNRNLLVLFLVLQAGCVSPSSGTADEFPNEEELSVACLAGTCGACATCLGRCLCEGRLDAACRSECREAPPFTPDAGAMARPDAGEDPAEVGRSPRLPARPSSCPTMATGMVTVMGQPVQLWVGPRDPSQPGPLVFYWHGTGGRATEAIAGLGAVLEQIQTRGGVVASFTSSTRQGENTGNGVWFTGDFELADVILSCAVEQGLVDPRRVYASGCSAGGLQASAMLYERSGYLAGAMPNSGGLVRRFTLEDRAHVPAVIAAHGAPGVDVVVVDFSETSAMLTRDIAALGGDSVRCNHGGRHCASPEATKNAQWEYLLARPFGVRPELADSRLPASFPTYCQLVRP